MGKKENNTQYFVIGAIVSLVLILTNKISPLPASSIQSDEQTLLSTGGTGVGQLAQGRSRGDELTALILNWRTPRTLANTLKSYKKNGLFDYMHETVIFFQEITQEQEDKAKANHNKIRVIGDVGNVNIHWGLDYLVGNATTEYVLFLEKDWELIESPEKLREQIDASIAIIESGAADVVRLRSRKNPGRDFYAKETFQGREDAVWHQQENLMCNFYHWVDRFDWRFPDKVELCWQDPKFYCVKARFCNWTNNPCIFKKSWWEKNMAKYARKTKEEMKVWGNFESELNSVVEAWNLSPWVVALGDGLFTHHEIDG